MSLTTRYRRLFLVMLAAALSGLLVFSFACGGDDDDDDGGDDGATETEPADGDDDGGDGGELTLDIIMGDNFFEYEGEQNPTLSIPAGAHVTINLTNEGTAIHNMRISGEDGEYNTDDDAVSDPDLVSAGESSVLEWTAPDEAGEIDYQCDLHPTDMLGVISVE